LLLYKKKYFRGAKGILKGKLNGQHIEREVYERQDEIR
jgi:hypothetical protein